MSPKSRYAGGMMVAALGVAVLVWQESMVSRLRAANRSLSEQAATLSALQAERDQLAEQARTDEANARSARDRGELQRLRAEVSALRGRSATKPARAGDAPETGERRRPSGGTLRFGDARDVGSATPEDMIQSFVWAMRTGNVRRIQELGDWSTDGAAEAADKMSRELASAVATGGVEVDSMSIRVLRQVPLEDGDVALVTESRHGNDNHTSAQRIRRVGNEWRVVMGESGPQEVQLAEDGQSD